jgi:hypothetical protein
VTTEQHRSPPAAALLFLSGLAALVYQTIWIKQLTLVVDVDVYAVTTGGSGFSAGLASEGRWIAIALYAVAGGAALGYEVIRNETSFCSDWPIVPKYRTSDMTSSSSHAACHGRPPFRPRAWSGAGLALCQPDISGARFELAIPI